VREFGSKGGRVLGSFALREKKELLHLTFGASFLKKEEKIPRLSELQITLYSPRKGGQIFGARRKREPSLVNALHILEKLKSIFNS